MVSRGRLSLDEAAERFGLTKTRIGQIVRLALGLIAKKKAKSASAARTPLTPPRPTKHRHPKTPRLVRMRNLLIARLAGEGVSFSRLAVRFGITKQRVHQIVARAKARAASRAALADRNREFVRLANQGWSLRRIGRKFGRSGEAVRAVLLRMATRA